MLQPIVSGLSYVLDSRVINDRSKIIHARHRERIFTQASQFFGILMALQWIASIIAAIVISPFTWAGTESSIHVHVWSALILGGVIAIPAIGLSLYRPEGILTRHVIAASQMLFSGLLIHLSGGRIETHFHVFGSLAFLSLYRDWKVLISATVVVALDHLFRGIFWPESVYGVLSVSPWRTMEHAAWVVFEVSILVWASRRSVSEMEEIAVARARLESTQSLIEDEVKARTRELEETQENLRKTRDEALNLAQVKSDFLANMSHEIRTPMNGVLGMVELTLDTQLSIEQRDHLEAAHSSATALLTVINDILDFSKVEANKFSIAPIKANLRKVVIECERTLSPLANARSLNFVTQVSEDLPEQILADTARLRQVLINLIGNAIKFTSPGGAVVLQVNKRTGGDGEPKLHFTISDTGEGIPDDKQEVIFEPFSQANSKVSRKHGGTGLGLTISKAIVELMGGTISLKSRVGSGSRFEFEVPLVPVTKGEPKAASKPVGAEAESQSQQRALTILLAEDNRINQKVTEAILSRQGHSCIIAENGEEALTALKDKKFDLVLMDIQMPVMDGIEAIKRIRESENSWAKIPIIALTAHALSGDREELLTIGADGYVSKPIRRDEFLRTISELVNRPS